ncbi:MAG: FAD-dependent oxidoreductase [Pseudomonadota bacterium]
MRVIVLGAGVIGVTTAYALASRGYTVTVIDRRPEVAAEASFANGGQLSYDFASPMGSPGVLRHLADYLLGRDEAFKIQLSFDPGFMLWGTKFLANCLSHNAQRNTEKLALLAQASEASLRRIIENTGIAFNHRKSGKLVLFDNINDFERAKWRAQDATQNDRELTVVTANDCRRLEPSLDSWGGAPIIGGLFAVNDEVGDARAFSEALGKVASDKFGVRFILGTDVNSILTLQGKACGVVTDKNEFEADAVVVCMGVNAARLLRPVKISAAIQPICGYSITAPATINAPKIAITDLGRKMVYSRIGGDLRVAGFADAGAHSDEFRRGRIVALTNRAMETFGTAADFASISSRWIGVRPSTPNSLPIVGASKVPGLYLNIGHGMFGWTLSAICAEQLVRSMAPR